MSGGYNSGWIRSDTSANAHHLTASVPSVYGPCWIRAGGGNLLFWLACPQCRHIGHYPDPGKRRCPRRSSLAHWAGQHKGEPMTLMRLIDQDYAESLYLLGGIEALRAVDWLA